MGMVLTYNLLWIIGMPLAFPLVALSIISSRKRRKTVLQRFGIAVAPGLQDLKKSALDLHPLWVHALSVGEVLSAVSLARTLKQKYPDRSIVFSASTLTGFETASRLLQNDLNAVFYFPYDLIFSVRSVINRIHPALVVIVETDIWPNFLFEMKRRLIPVVLVNARLSDRSYSGYRRFSKWTSPVFQCFSFVCAQSGEDARRFMGLGLPADKVTISGNMKYDSTPDLVSENAIQYLRRILSGITHQKCLVAGSTHPGEEAILLDAYSRLKADIPALCLILAPRDIDRAIGICNLAVSQGFAVELLTRMEGLTTLEPPDVVVVNTIGHLKTLYALCDVAFVGGSLINFGGHNPLEPAAFAKPILFGPHTSDVAESCNRLLAAGGAQVVRNATELVQATLTLLKSPEHFQEMGNNAFQILQKNRGALEKTLNAIGRFIQK
ncbi:MAG: 3-deoxy-D-manno-octulosonic acid transferase [Deltaproteobacteria bacterium]|nr:3-deoxy-D-manno-octulosonic acid transferase [Deltaproteobacteria bacterium]